MSSSDRLTVEDVMSTPLETISKDARVHLLAATGDSTAVGTVGFTRVNLERQKAEVGYWIAPDHQGQGYGTEAVELLVGYGFEQRGFHRLEARVTDFNEPSWRLLESLGFTREGTLREHDFVDGQFRDTHWYGLLAQEWLAADDDGT
jgi:RimJ/RimL family protein N-acetyltransferase